MLDISPSPADPIIKKITAYRRVNDSIKPSEDCPLYLIYYLL